MFFSSWSQQVNFALVVYCYPLGNVNFLSAKWFKTKLNMREEQKGDLLSSQFGFAGRYILAPNHDSASLFLPQKCATIG